MGRVHSPQFDLARQAFVYFSRSRRDGHNLSGPGLEQALDYEAPVRALPNFIEVVLGNVDAGAQRGEVRNFEELLPLFEVIAEKFVDSRSHNGALNRAGNLERRIHRRNLLKLSG